MVERPRHPEDIERVMRGAEARGWRFAKGRKYYKAYCPGVVQHMRFHDLRHTYASLMLAAGFKPHEVSRWMGHASVSTTNTIYGHLYSTGYDDQIARFEALVAEC